MGELIIRIICSHSDHVNYKLGDNNDESTVLLTNCWLYMHICVPQ